MSAEVLREAGALMRERAEAATAGPWTHAHEGLQGGEVIRGAGDVHRVARVYKSAWPDYLADCENATHIASWHPAVALAVSDWLDTEADVLDDPHERGHARPTPALAVALAYLGSDS